MPNIILISGFLVWMKRAAAPLTVEFKGNSFRTLEAVGMTGILFEILCHIMGSWKRSLSQPYFGQVWGWSPTLGKVGIWSPLGLSNVQSSTVGPKTPRIGVFLVSLERSWSVDIENALALAIRTSTAQVMGKRRTTKSRESTSSRSPNWECDTSLERSRRGLQVWFRPCRDQILQSGVMSSQSPGTPPGTILGRFRDNFGTPFLESREFVPFGSSPHGGSQSIL